jgi:hypothetical protein
LISKTLKSPATEDLVWFALKQLEKGNLIENIEELPNQFAGMSRREVIKKSWVRYDGGVTDSGWNSHPEPCYCLIMRVGNTRRG